MISEAFQCIFVHIPKTGGQSIEHFFLSRLRLTWENRETLLMKFNSDRAKGPERLAHLTATEYVSLGYVSREQYNNYFTFSFVRNPWSRLVSEYFYQNHHHTMTFPEYLRYGLPERDSYSDKYRHVMPQYDFLHDEAGKLQVDFVGKFENLQGDFNIVAEALGISEPFLPHVNANANREGLSSLLSRILGRDRRPTRRDYTDFYDDESRSIVEFMYSQDIGTFGYKFGE
jgi:hypothetical protein